MESDEQNIIVVDQDNNVIINGTMFDHDTGIVLPQTAGNYSGGDEPSYDVGADNSIYMQVDSEDNIIAVWGKINGAWKQFPQGGGGSNTYTRQIPFNVTNSTTSTINIREGE